jgi:putative DNA methylase
MSKYKIPKKLIEVALPLDDINAACAHEKMPGIGPHPRGIHLWWARRPLAAARAVLFAQMVNDPGGERGWTSSKTKAQADFEREALFDIIRDLVKWENTTNEEVLARARAAIRNSWRETCALNKGKPGFDPEKLPAFHDPFAGGGAIPLEAQRLGLESHASDLNPVAVMINKAMIEIPPRFAGQAPIGPIPKGEQEPDALVEWKGAQGLAEDVRRYGHWMHEEAFKRIGHLYPKVKVVKEKDGSFRYATTVEIETPKSKVEELTVIAWLWARTVKSPNPAFSNVEVPLVKSFVLSAKKGNEKWVQVIPEQNGYRFAVHSGKIPKDQLGGTVNRKGGTCILSNSTMPFTYIRDEGKAGRMGTRLMAVVAKGKRGRVYLSPRQDIEDIAYREKPVWKPENELAFNPRNFQTPIYGMNTYGDLFTDRQLIALGTLSELLTEAREKIKSEASKAGMPIGGPLAQGGFNAQAYAEAVSIYLAFVVDRCADFNNSLTGWRSGNEKIMYLFSRQAIPMVWDYGEANIMENVVGGFTTNLEYQVKCLLTLSGSSIKGCVAQQDAADQSVSADKVVSTDPPYYNNIAYADLSDFFYVWMRRALRPVYPELFATMAVPKAEELVATPYRHGTKEKAETFFMDGMTRAMHNLAKQAHSAFPVTIYYAVKQSETADAGTSNTGWETFLEAVLRAGFSIDGTWPMRTEGAGRMIGQGTNALASSIILVCQKREAAAEQISRKAFLKELREVMPEALETMIGGETGRSPIAPVDLAQAAIGPGMAVFSKYAAVLNQDGSPMGVHDALILINRAITDYLSPDAGNYDADTLFCSAWFDLVGWSAGEFGDANTLAQAKGTTVDGVKEAGVIESGAGKVKLLKWADYPADWDPKLDNRTPVWEACHHMIRTLNAQGETASGELLARMPERAEPIRQLAYHLYTLCERNGRAEDARAYNELITSWSAIVAASHERGHINEQIDLI